MSAMNKSLARSNKTAKALAMASSLSRPVLWLHGGLKMIRPGDRVKLIARKRPSKLTARQSKLTARRGVVERITTNKANAVVLWGGRKSKDYLPIRSIESEPAELG